MRLAGSNPYTSVYHSLWYESKDIRHEAATKILNENLIDRSTFIVSINIFVLLVKYIELFFLQ